MHYPWWQVWRECKKDNNIDERNMYALFKTEYKH